MTTGGWMKKLKDELPRIEHPGGAVLIALLVGLALGWWFFRAREVQATRFVLVDGWGNRRAVLEMGGHGPGLKFYGEDGKALVWMGAYKDGAIMNMYDETGQGRIGMMVADDVPTVSLYDEAGQGRLGLKVDGGGAGLSLNDRQGNPRAGIEVDGDGGVRRSGR